jgi:hypothetical protein
MESKPNVIALSTSQRYSPQTRYGFVEEGKFDRKLAAVAGRPTKDADSRDGMTTVLSLISWDRKLGMNVWTLPRGLFSRKQEQLEEHHCLEQSLVYLLAWRTMKAVNNQRNHIESCANPTWRKMVFLAMKVASCPAAGVAQLVEKRRLHVAIPHT